MIGYFCSGFIDFILKGKSLTDFANLFYVLTNKSKKNDKEVLSHFDK